MKITVLYEKIIENYVDFQRNDYIDDLKSVCASSGLGNDGNEFKLLLKFAYKYLNDKFV